MPDLGHTVFVVDDDVSVRESLFALLQLEGWSPRCFDSARAFLEESAVDGPCCLILDVGLPDLNGLDLQTLISSKHQEMPIIFITGFGDVPTAVKAMKAGAVEFLTKPISDNKLIGAIRSALEKSRASLVENLELQVLRDRYKTLSGREREVMGLVVKGWLNKQVGGMLGISEITVKAHRGRVMQKMQARSLAGLVMMNSALGLEQAQGR